MKNDDQRIIEMLFDRDEQALTITSDKYGALCQKIAYNIIGDHEDADECVNNSLLQLWNAIPPARPKSLKAYLCGIVHNISVDFRKKHKAYNGTQVILSELLHIFPDSQRLDEIFDRKILAACINEFLSGQAEVNRKVFVMRYYYNYSIRDISLTLKMKEATVKTKLFRMRNDLKSFLLGKGYNI